MLINCILYNYIFLVKFVVLNIKCTALMPFCTDHTEKELIRLLSGGMKRHLR
ncbi:MAG: hypothetical protein K0S24_4120 [Sphingobacterium sp.]|jgi:hypothetical protein|nr:hypothetical protein [Sphingobacterium sp.]